MFDMALYLITDKMRSMVLFALVFLSLVVESHAKYYRSYSSGGGDGDGGWIVGAVLGGIALVSGVVALIIICCVCKKKGSKGSVISPQTNSGVAVVGSSTQPQAVAYQNNQAYSSGFQYNNYSAYPPPAAGYQPPPSYSQPGAEYPTKQ